jgi:hypothetical protein
MSARPPRSLSAAKRHEQKTPRAVSTGKRGRRVREEGEKGERKEEGFFMTVQKSERKRTGETGGESPPLPLLCRPLRLGGSPLMTAYSSPHDTWSPPS